jgi:UDP-glucuronate decarboxylase
MSDAAAAITNVLTSDASGEAFNVGNDEEVTIRQVAEIVDEVSQNGRGVRLTESTDTEYLTDNPQRRCPDLNKVKQMTGWAPRVSLQEGIARTLRFYQDEAGRWK